MVANPDEKHWEAFRKYLLKSKAKYYMVFYPKALKGKEDLTDAYVVLYDSRYLPMFKVPVIIKSGGKVEGATIYLMGLKVSNRV